MPAKTLVFLSLLLLVLLSARPTQAAQASLTLVPASGTVLTNQTFNLEIRVNTAGETINTVTANLSYPIDKIRVTKVDTTNSFVTIWFENSIAQDLGKVKLTGSISSPGTSGSNLLLATLTLQALAVTTTGSPANISFDNTSAIYRNSDNTNILSSSVGAQFTITASGTSTLTPVPSISQTTPTPSPSPTILPVGLPDVGDNSPTIILLILGFLLIIGGISLTLKV